MRIHNFDSNPEILNEIVNFIANRNLIPVFGSGFTRKCNAHNGSVPSGGDMEAFMRQQIASATSQKLESLEKYKFQQLCSLYNKRVSWDIRSQYLMNNFANVSLSSAKKSFINIAWNCIYTLNIDDAIENNITSYRRQVILPKTEFLDQYVNNFDVIFKIHGDVHNYLSDKDSRGLIFDKAQYINSLKNNKHMLAKFATDFADSNMVYIGCSLDDEPDLLSAIQNAIQNSPVNHNVYYVTVVTPDSNIQDLLEDYGITDYVFISDLDFFCKAVTEAMGNINTGNNNLIDFYKNKEIVTLNPTQSNLDFLLQSDNLIRLPFENFKKPHFFIYRNAVKDVLDALNRMSPIHIIYGHRISGKTYCLYGIYEQIKNKDRYFFPSGISITKDMLNQVLTFKNSLFVFDTATLGIDQLINITKSSKKIKLNNSYIVIAVNSSDRLGIDLGTGHFGHYDTTEISNVFAENEETKLNGILQNTNIPTFSFNERIQRRGTSSFYAKKNSLLDNLYKTALAFSKNNKDFLLPDISNTESPIELALLVVLATNQPLGLDQVHYFSLEEECKSFVSAYPTLASMCFIGRGRSSKNSSCQVVINARYYLLKTLGGYATNKDRKELILKAYRYIYQKIDEAEFDRLDKSRKMLDFVKYDVINDIFFEKNEAVTFLIKYLYQQLEQELNVAPQFKHQRAKCILWLFNNELSEIKDAVKYIDLSEHDMNNIRAKKPDNIRVLIAYEHICYTQAIIYGRLCALEKYSNIDNIEKAIACYGRAILSPWNEKDLRFLREKRLDNRVAADLRSLLEYAMENDIPSGIKFEAQELNNMIGDI